MELSFFPTLNASLNALTTCFLLAGFIAIKNGRKVTHRALMISALTSSTVFLGCYLYYHFHFPTTPFPRHDWTRPLYFAILIPHIILAVVMLPFIFMAVYRAARGEFEKHKRITRWLWPVWMYVSVTGVLVYFMLYHWCR
jgi:putative membrane protein